MQLSAPADSERAGKDERFRGESLPLLSASAEAGSDAKKTGGGPARGAAAQPLPPKGAGAQMSLLEVVEEKPAPQVSRVEDLPDYRGMNVALVWCRVFDATSTAAVEGR